MTIDAEFWTRTVNEIDEWMISSRGAQEQGDRLFAEVMQTIERYVDYRPMFVPRLVKSRRRLLEKAQALHLQDASLSSEAIAQKMTDVAAGRLLVIGLRDIELAYRWCHDYQVNHPSKVRFVEERRMFADTKKPGGFRGLMQKTEIVLSNGDCFPFELQIMTYLQHSWDQLQHGFYELMRKAPGPVAAKEEVNRRFEILSDRLYELDQELDATKQAMIV